MKTIDYKEINRNFIIRVEKSDTYYRVLQQGHAGKFFVNEKYPLINISEHEGTTFICLSDNEGSQYPFLEEEVRKLKKESKLYSADTYAELVGETIANKHFLEVLNNGKYKTTYKLRRGLTINFCSK
ncbi:hypothetical protein [Flavivirga sp. 57AJ16]|uniref:hypothetical protein n=1 Tax=Flavivirga sp. 57AJ16 TaxID=3025307 RepID=UPI0023669227|nr:hypothetical protein [Flavivirga sp. 57AJ16]MDD7885757.1 hypothetical protein [Flavivirga sp. 57AJ16]